MPEYDSTILYRDITGFPGYKVGSDGSVWSCWKRVNLGWRYGSKYVIGDNWARMKPGRTDSGYLIVTLCPGRKNKLIHRLVLEAFVGPAVPGMVCRHFPDRDPSNNSLGNLQWGTPAENQADCIAHGTDRRGSKHHKAKLIESQVLEIRARYSSGGITQKALGMEYGVGKHVVQQIVSRNSWRHL